MSSNTSVNVNFGGLLGLIGVVLIILKLGEVAPVVNWSWWLVLMPFWFGVAVLGVVLFFVLLVYGIVGLVTLFTNLRR